MGRVLLADPRRTASVGPTTTQRTECLQMCASILFRQSMMTAPVRLTAVVSMGCLEYRSVRKLGTLCLTFYIILSREAILWLH